jgi:hypothetical protein
MKYIYNLLSTFTLILLFSAHANASVDKVYHPDTIRMQIPNGTTIEYKGSYSGKSTLEQTFKLKEQLSEFLKKWDVLNVKNLDANKSYKIKCTSVKKYQEEIQLIIDIEEKTFKQRVVFPSDKVAALSFKGRNLLIVSPELSIHFDRVEQLRELAKMDLNQTLHNTDRTLQDNYYNNSKSFNAWVKVKEDFSTELISQQNLKSDADQILLSAGASLENVKGKWNAGIYMNMTMLLGNKGNLNHAFKFEYEWMYDFSSSKKNINHWLTLGYARNLSTNPNKTNWLGVNLGYLAKRKGDLFEKDSFRIGVNKKIHRNVSVEPQLYFHGFFKDIHPGIKLKINL